MIAAFANAGRAFGDDDYVQGSGLGLAIVHQIAQLHGGEVELSDNAPTGTCAMLTLPLTPTASEAPVVHRVGETGERSA